MSSEESPGSLDRRVEADDHIIGPAAASLTLVEYGSYACPRCRAANGEVDNICDELGERFRYVFRHRPLQDNELARRAAELAECAADNEEFWRVHALLMGRSATLTAEDLRAVEQELRLDELEPAELSARKAAAAARVDRDDRSSRNSGVKFTPTFFINGRRYDGAWDAFSLTQALLGTLGHRVHAAALSFGSWAPSAALLLGFATLLALLLANSPAAAAVASFWHLSAGIDFAGYALSLPLIEWINDGLLTVFFLVVGLEVKREFTVGRLATRRLAALPIAAALGGLLVPAGLYAAIIGSGPWLGGAGIPMPTDTAFAIALIVMLGPRVPIELRVFLTAASIVDDIGTIAVVAIFYAHGINLLALAIAAVVVVMLAFLNRSGIYRPWPYAVLGIVLWFAVHAGGVHATLAGVLLAMFIPTRPPPNLNALLAQAETVIVTETQRQGTDLHHGASASALRAIDAIHDRIESPADRLLRVIEPWSSYFVLPLFALANAGLAISADLFDGRGVLAAAIAAGLIIGKPIGFVLASVLAFKSGLAARPVEFSMRQLAGAGALAGIGFTMSLFIAGRSLPDAADFAAAKAAIFIASAVSGIVGCLLLASAARKRQATSPG
jgi:Na+:H+ antiporter, NhaA family